jgi:hypothetical protein
MARNKSEGIYLDVNDQYMFAIPLKLSSGVELQVIFLYENFRYLLSILPACLCLLRLVRVSSSELRSTFLLIFMYLFLQSRHKPLVRSACSIYPSPTINQHDITHLLSGTGSYGEVRNRNATWFQHP